MGFLTSIGSSFFDSFTDGISGNIGVVDYLINPLAQEGYDKFWRAQRDNSIANARAQIALMPEQVQGYRKALESAGYNPILGVGSAGSIPSAGVVSSGDMIRPGSPSNLMDNAAKSAQVDQIEAQTDYIKKRTLGEGWQVKTLSRSEAMGLGAHLGRLLGFNFNDSSQTTFLVAYNPITGELRNLGDTASGLGTTGETNDAATVRAQFEGDENGPLIFRYRKGESSPYQVDYDHTARQNLPR